MATKGSKKAAEPEAAKKVAAAKRRGTRVRGRTIDAAVEKVAASKGRKPGLSAAEKATRDTAIVARSAQGWTASRVAAAFSVSVRTVGLVLKAHRESPSGMDVAPMRLVEDLLRQLRTMVGDFEHLSHVFVNDHPGVAMQAKRQARETLADLVALERMLGLLPTNLGLFRAEADLRHLGETVLDKLAELERGECEAGDVVRLVREDVMAQALRDLPARN